MEEGGAPDSGQVRVKKRYQKRELHAKNPKEEIDWAHLKNTGERRDTIRVAGRTFVGRMTEDVGLIFL